MDALYRLIYTQESLEIILSADIMWPLPLFVCILICEGVNLNSYIFTIVIINVLPQVVNLLDGRRSLTINIFLKQFKK